MTFVRTMALLERFEEQFIPEPMSGCWLWLGYMGTCGYPEFMVGSRIDGSRRKQRAAHTSWDLYREESREGQQVLHTCNNRACVSPHHLYLGTAQDNIADRVKSGRSAGRYTRPARCRDPVVVF